MDQEESEFQKPEKENLNGIHFQLLDSSEVLHLSLIVVNIGQTAFEKIDEAMVRQGIKEIGAYHQILHSGHVLPSDLTK